MTFANDDVLLFTGDSITDCGRGRPVGRAGALGDGYVSMVAAKLMSSHTELTVLNTGISGNRVPDLERRWQKEVLDLKPDWLSVLIGINDVWRQFDSPLAMAQVGIEEFQQTYRKLLKQTRPMLKGLVLMTPYFIEPDATDPMRMMMDSYGAVVKKLAGEFDAVLVDLQASFNKYLEKQPVSSLCDDRVHPNKIGHQLIAHSFLKEMGMMGRGKAET